MPGFAACMPARSARCGHRFGRQQPGSHHSPLLLLSSSPIHPPPTAPGPGSHVTRHSYVFTAHATCLHNRTPGLACDMTRPPLLSSPSPSATARHVFLPPSVRKGSCDGIPSSKCA
eukprot:183170-Chlamydomonas_euryale.AAC.1